MTDISPPSQSVITVAGAILPSTLGRKLVDATMEGRDDVLRELLKTVTDEEVNWQNEV